METPLILDKDSETALTQPSHVMGTEKRVCFNCHQPRFGHKQVAQFAYAWSLGRTWKGAVVPMADLFNVNDLDCAWARLVLRSEI